MVYELGGWGGANGKAKGIDIGNTVTITGASLQEKLLLFNQLSCERNQLKAF